MIRNTDFRQGVRHETISIALLNELNDWLEPIWQRLPEWARNAVFFSVSGHHLKFPDPVTDRCCSYNNVIHVTKAIVYLQHNDFITLLGIGRSKFGLGQIPLLKNITYNLLNIGNLLR